METLTKVLDNQHQNLIRYDRMLSSNEMTFEEAGRLSSHIFHHSDDNFQYQYVNQHGCDWFCLSISQIVEMESCFLKKFYHPDTLLIEFPKIARFFQGKEKDIVYSNYQQIYNPTIQAFSMCLVFIKKCRVLSGYICITQPIEKDLNISKKLNRIMAEEEFRKNHEKDFDDLTLREGQILKLLAEGLSNPQISNHLFISRRTVEQHRKNINRKLHVHTFRDILSYAYAFDLV